MDNLNENIISEFDETIEKLEELEKEKEKQIEILEALIDGSITEDKNASITFEERKENILNEIKELEKAIEKEELEKFAKQQALEFSNKVGYPEGLDEMNATNSFYKWVENPEENIESLINYTNALPEESRVKEFLNETIRRANEKDYGQEEAQVVETISEEPKTDTLQEYISAKDKLKEINDRPGRFATDQEREVIRIFAQATANPNEENIKIAREAANNLPQFSEIKEQLLITIEKLEKHHIPKTTSQTIEQVVETVVAPTTAIETPTNHSIEETLQEKMAALREEYIRVEMLQQQMAEKYGPMIGIIRNELEVIREKKSRIQNDITSTLYNNDIPTVKESFSIPKIIKNVKQTKDTLLEKIHKIDFKKKVNESLNWMKEHKKAAIAIGTGLFIAGASLLGIKQNKEEKQPETNPTEIENQNENTEEIDTNQELTSEIPTENAWANIETMPLYTAEQVVETAINNGGEIVARYDNDGVPMGYDVMGQSQENNSGISK